MIGICLGFILLVSTRQGWGAVTALPRGGFAGVRQTVWERTGLAHLPIFTSSPTKSSPASTPVKMEDMVDPPVSSHLGYSSSSPEVNYKHLYLVHRTISRRIRNGSDNGRERENGNTPMIIDAISSIEAGGLSGHSEAIYALTLFRHPMSFGLNVSCATCEGSTTAGNEGVLISGRDWLLSGSRDKTMRLWQLDCPKPRVVKVFVGAHAGSVLSLYTVKVGVDVPSSSTNQGGSGRKSSEAIPRGWAASKVVRCAPVRIHQTRIDRSPDAEILLVSSGSVGWDLWDVHVIFR